MSLYFCETYSTLPYFHFLSSSRQTGEQKIEREKACHFKVFSHKAQAGALDSPRKLFGTPACVQSARSFIYKDAKIIGAENHHTTREAILTIIVDNCFMQLYIVRTSLSIGTGVGVPLANVSKIV